MIFARRRSSCSPSPLFVAEHLQRGAIVDVLAACVNASTSAVVAREVRQHAQLDLRVVGRDQHVAGLGDERAADLAPELGADRDVLQVGIAAAQAAGGGDRLVEAGVDAAGLGVDQLRQRIDVGALELLQRAPLEDQPRHVVRERQLLEHFDGGRRASSS